MPKLLKKQRIGPGKGWSTPRRIQIRRLFRRRLSRLNDRRDSNAPSHKCGSSWVGSRLIDAKQSLTCAAKSHSSHVSGRLVTNKETAPHQPVIRYSGAFPNGRSNKKEFDEFGSLMRHVVQDVPHRYTPIASGCSRGAGSA